MFTNTKSKVFTTPRITLTLLHPVNLDIIGLADMNSQQHKVKCLLPVMFPAQ